MCLSATIALSDYEHALVLDPTEIQVYLMKGNALSVLDQHQDALLTYKKALALNPSEIGQYITTL
jgi:tetratricopeptide (TPR) repeat protein